MIKYHNNNATETIIILTCLSCNLLLYSCTQSTQSLNDFINESLNTFLSDVKPDSIDTGSVDYNRANSDCYFSFTIIRNSDSGQNILNTIDTTEAFGSFKFSVNDTVYLNQIFTSETQPLYFSLYRETELILQEKTSDGLCLSEKVFQFPGKYTFGVTFQTNKIIQEACFQIIINN